MMLRLTTLVLLVFLIGCTTTNDRSDEENRRAAETNTALGRQYMERGDYEIALEKLKRAVAYDKTYAPAHTMLGILYETIGDSASAGNAYRTAVKFDPTGGDVNNNYGAYLCGAGQRREALPYFEAAVRDPFYDTPEVALSNAGSCALAAGDLDKAETFLRQSLGYDDKLGASLLPMAEVSYKQQSYLRARGFLQRFEAVSSTTEESLLLGYAIESELGDQDSAERYRLELLERYPGALKAGSGAGQGQE
jgi:type IV pilus assembly protein PilF